MFPNQLIWLFIMAFEIMKFHIPNFTLNKSSFDFMSGISKKSVAQNENTENQKVSKTEIDDFT